MASQELKKIKQYQIRIQEQRQIRLDAGKKEKQLKDELNQYELDVTGLSNKEGVNEEAPEQNAAVPEEDEDEEADEDYDQYAGSQAEEAEEDEEEEEPENEHEEELPVIKELVAKRPSTTSEQEGKRAKLISIGNIERARKLKNGKTVRKHDKERG